MLEIIQSVTILVVSYIAYVNSKDLRELKKRISEAVDPKE